MNEVIGSSYFVDCLGSKLYPVTKNKFKDIFKKLDYSEVTSFEELKHVTERAKIDYMLEFTDVISQVKTYIDSYTRR